MTAGQAAVQGLAVGDVTGPLLACCRGRSLRWARLLAAAVRFLFMVGPTPAGLSGASLPSATGQDQARRLPSSRDRRHGRAEGTSGLRVRALPKA
ncbi:MAG TPA: hypothetical protein VF060_25195, partial [Trebonia sp.]